MTKYLSSQLGKDFVILLFVYALHTNGRSPKANCDTRNYFSDVATHAMTRKYIGHTDVLLELIPAVNKSDNRLFVIEMQRQSFYCRQFTKDIKTYAFVRLHVPVKLFLVTTRDGLSNCYKCGREECLVFFS